MAVDSWACEMLPPEMEAFGSSCQTIGLRVGSFISTAVYLSLNSLNFCQTWIYPSDSFMQVPLLTMQKFMMIWIGTQLATTLYIIFFTQEQDEDEAENAPQLSDTLAIFADVLQNKNLRLYFTFKFVCWAAISIHYNTVKIYVTSELNMDMDSIASVKVFTTPFILVLAVVSGWLSSKNPFKTSCYIRIALVVFCSYSILFVLGTYPETPGPWS